MSLREIIYVNKRRLDLYIEQISSAVAYDKVPTVSTRLSLLGPDVNVEQSRHARPFTDHEKINQLENYLKTHDQLLTGSPFLEASDVKPFVCQTLHARKIFIPANRSDAPAWFKGLGMWISTDAVGTNGRVYLLEDLHGGDAKIEFISAYSALQLLGQEFIGLAEFSVAATAFSASIVRHETRQDSFSTDPFEFLRALGAHLIPEDRFITVLYRLRTHFYEEVRLPNGGGLRRPSIVGYPIFIALAE